MEARHAKQGEAFKALLETNRLSYKTFAVMRGVSYDTAKAWGIGKSVPVYSHVIEKLRSALPANFYAQMAVIYPIMQKSAKERKQEIAANNAEAKALWQKRNNAEKAKARKKALLYDILHPTEERKRKAAAFDAAVRKTLAQRYAL